MTRLIALAAALFALTPTTAEAADLPTTTIATIGGTGLGMAAGAVAGAAFWGNVVVPAKYGDCSHGMCGLAVVTDTFLIGAPTGMALGATLGSGAFHAAVDAPGTGRVMLASGATAAAGITALVTYQWHHNDALAWTGVATTVIGTPTAAILTARRQQKRSDQPLVQLTSAGPTLHEDGFGVGLSGRW